MAAASYSLFQQLPDSVLLHVFSFLDGPSLSRASCVCEQWNRVADDDVLWRDIVLGIIRKHAPLPPGKDSWRGEYQHLTHHAPIELSQEVAGHTDEVYFLIFSPSGKYLASVGRDGTCRLWNYNNKGIALQRTAGPFFDPPQRTLFCEFNESETMLMVTGFGQNFDFDGNIFVAVLSIPDLHLMSAVQGKYPNFRGAWLNNTQFLICSLFFNQGYKFRLVAHEVKLSSTKKEKKLKDLFTKSSSEGRTVLKTFPCNSRNDFIRVVDPGKWGDLSQYYDFTEKSGGKRDVRPSSCRCGVVEGNDGDRTDEEAGKTNNDFSDIEVNCDESDDDSEDNALKPKGNRDSDENLSDFEDDWDYWDEEEDIDDDDDLYSDAGDVSKSYSDIIREIQASGCKIILMVHSFHPDVVRSVIALYSVKDGDVNFNKPFKRLKMDAEIVGLRISPDHRYLVYSSRAMVDVYRYGRVYDRDILTIVYDMILDQCVRTVYTGSSASSPIHLSYIFPDISKDFIAMGDEGYKLHIWDRHYGIAIQSNIAHLDCGERACGLNAVAFHPHDQETLVTAGDDKLLKVWKSKHRLAEMSRPPDTKSKYEETKNDYEAHQSSDLYEVNDETHRDCYEGDTDDDDGNPKKLEPHKA